MCVGMCRLCAFLLVVGVGAGGRRRCASPAAFVRGGARRLLSFSGVAMTSSCKVGNLHILLLRSSRTSFESPPFDACHMRGLAQVDIKRSSSSVSGLQASSPPCVFILPHVNLNSITNVCYMVPRFKLTTSTTTTPRRETFVRYSNALSRN